MKLTHLQHQLFNEFSRLQNIKIKEFQKNWKVSITSPRGSIISADSQTEIDHSPVLNEVITKLAEKKQKEAGVILELTFIPFNSWNEERWDTSWNV